MLRGLYNSAMGMTTQMQRMDVVANNLANADTLGFKRDVVVTQSFADALGQRIREYDLGITNRPNVGFMSLGTFVHTLHTDFSIGSLRLTGGALDLAMDGLGFFQINHVSSTGEETLKFTRSGNFLLNQDRILMTMDGMAVLSASGNPITIPDGEIVILANGEIQVNGEAIDQIGMVQFEDPQTLRAFGNNLFMTTEESVIEPFAGNLIQGYLENSNVNTVREMVEMISLARVYEANQHAFGIRDQIFGQAVSEIARR